MFPALHKKFLIITPSLASAFPEATSTITTSASSPSSTSLPVSLQALIPECAQSCVESILFDEWPLGCASSGDLECLCSRYSTTGLTLGEAAYACAVTSCASSTPDLASTYSICSGQHGAVVATHSTLTFTAHITSIADTTAETASSTSIRSNTTSTRLSSSTSSSRSSSSRTTLDSSTTPASSASSTSSVPSSTSSQAPASSSAAAAAAAGSSSNDGNGLSTAQIVGISVASVSAVVLAVGVLFLMACLRKRDRKKQEEVSEKQGRSMFALTPPSHDNVAMSPSALEQFPSPPRNRKDPRNGAGVGTGISIPQVRVDAASPPRQRAPTPLENIGLAITEDSPIASPASFSSNRTVSQLLPDKPEPVMPRQPDAVPKSPVPTSAPFIAKRKKPSQRDSSMTQDTVFEDTAFEEDTAVRKSMYPAKAVSVPPRKQQPPPIAPPVRPYRPPPSFAQEYTASPDTTRQPSLSLTIPPQGRQYPRQPTPSPPPIPSPLRIARPPNVAKPPIPLYYHRPAAAVLPPATDAHSSGSSGSTKFTGTNSTASSSYIPAYYTSPPTSILQTPPESYGGHGTSAAFSNNGPVPQTQSTSWSPQRQAQTTSPPHATTSTTQNRLPPQPQPAFAHPGPSTTGHQQRTTQQGTQANPPALRQWYPPPAPVAAVPANGHQQPAFPPPYRQHTSAGSTSLAQPPAAAKSQGSQYIPYSVPTAYARPPLPPQPQSPSRPPRGNARDARAAGQQTATTRPPLIKGDRVQRSTSSASMTSFESASPGDPSPPEDEETAAKQLGPDHHPQHHRRQKSADTGSHRRHNHPVQQMSGGRLTPNANEADEDDADADRSPISDIRYPKVPRASNQAVPRSSPNAGPRTATPSPRVNQQGDASPSVANSPQGLLARRRGEGNGLLIDSGSGTPMKKGSRSPRTPENRIIGGGGGGDEEKDQARKSSAALPPAERGVGDATIATPTWVPRLTPTRRGDDLYLAVAYASKEGIP